MISVSPVSISTEFGSTSISDIISSISARDDPSLPESVTSFNSYSSVIFWYFSQTSCPISFVKVSSVTISYPGLSSLAPAASKSSSSIDSSATPSTSSPASVTFPNPTDAASSSEEESPSFSDESASFQEPPCSGTSSSEGPSISSSGGCHFSPFFSSSTAASSSSLPSSCTPLSPQATSNNMPSGNINFFSIDDSPIRKYILCNLPPLYIFSIIIM